MNILYRTGRDADCQTLAELIDIASDGVAKFLCHDLVPGLSLVQLISQELAGDNYPHSYKSAIVAEIENEVIGMALSYPSHFHKITDEMRKFFPKERLEHLKHFYSSRVENSWYLDALAVKPKFRRQGVGSKLIELTKEKAKQNGYDVLSLIVFADNLPAIALYNLQGFEVVKKVELAGNDLIPHYDGCLLMKCDI